MRQQRGEELDQRRAHGFTAADHAAQRCARPEVRLLRAVTPLGICGLVPSCLTAAHEAGTHAQQGLQLRGHEAEARHGVPPAHARQVLRVLLAAGSHDDKTAAAGKGAEDLLRQRSADSESAATGGLCLCTCIALSGRRPGAP